MNMTMEPDLAAKADPPTHPSSASSAGWLKRLHAIAIKAISLLPGRASTTPEEVIEDEDLESLLAWSITARLAAVPGSYLEQVPPEVAKLIREAKTLHPQMADGADERDARGEPCPLL